MRIGGWDVGQSSTWPRNFDAAISLYERSGWVRVAETEALIGETKPLREYVYLGPDTTGTS